jgi:hypothetical protein
MKNRFGNREVLCDGISFNPNVGGAGGVNPSNNVNSARVDMSALEAIGRITGEAGDRNNLSASGKICTACHM